MPWLRSCPGPFTQSADSTNDAPASQVGRFIAAEPQLIENFVRVRPRPHGWRLYRPRRNAEAWRGRRVQLIAQVLEHLPRNHMRMFFRLLETQHGRKARI